MKTLLLSAILLVATPTVALDGHETGNGGGIAEKTVIHAYLNLRSYLGICLNSSVCGLEPKERELVVLIQSSLNEEYKNTHQIVFRSEKADAGFFVIDGNVRIAKTGNAVGDTIYINSDLLYSDKNEPLTLGMAVATIVHELGHHHRVKDHTALDLLGMKIEKALSNQIFQTRAMSVLSSQSMVATFIEGHRFHEVLVSNGTDFVDVTKLIERRLYEICGTIEAISQYKIINLGWWLPVIPKSVHEVPAHTLFVSLWVQPLPYCNTPGGYRYAGKRLEQIYLVITEDLKVH